jgi:hypothetical protein
MTVLVQGSRATTLVRPASETIRLGAVRTNMVQVYCRVALGLDDEWIKYFWFDHAASFWTELDRTAIYRPCSYEIATTNCSSSLDEHRRACRPISILPVRTRLPEREATKGI